MLGRTRHMDFIHAHWTELLIGVLGSLTATAIVALISWSRKWPPLPVPLWIIALIVAFPIIWFAMSRFKPVPPIPVVDQNFDSQRVVLDGKQFIRCNFDRCSLVFKGDAPFGLERCSFTAPKLVFESGASVTLFQLRKLRSDPVFDAMIQESIKKE